MAMLVSDFEANKKEIEVSLTRTILTQLDKENITSLEAQEMARYILGEIDIADTMDKMLFFLQTLSKRWPVFESIAGFYKIRVKEAKEAESKANEIKNIQNKLSNI